MLASLPIPLEAPVTITDFNRWDLTNVSRKTLRVAKGVPV